MSVPARTELDAIAQALTADAIDCPPEGLTYGELPVEQRVIVMQLTIANEASELLSSIDDELQTIGKFFRASKPYYP